MVRWVVGCEVDTGRTGERPILTSALLSRFLPYRPRFPVFPSRLRWGPGVVPEPTRQVSQAGARCCCGGGRGQERLLGQEIRLVPGRREQRGQEHRPGQHGGPGPQPQSSPELRRERRRRRRRAEPCGSSRSRGARGPGRRARQGWCGGGGSSGSGGCSGSGGGCCWWPGCGRGPWTRLGSRSRPHHFHPGFARGPLRQRPLFAPKTQRCQSRLSEEQYVLIWDAVAAAAAGRARALAGERGERVGPRLLSSLLPWLLPRGPKVIAIRTKRKRQCPHFNSIHTLLLLSPSNKTSKAKC